MIIIRLLFVIFVLIGLLFIIINILFSFKNDNKPLKKNDKHKFCILIPARDESNVIEDLLISIKKQTFKIDMKDVYVIVESKEDKTISICNNYKTNVVYRKDLSKKRKGYALDDAVKEILKSNKHYDAYFIFDADNILDKDFIKNMIPVFDKGYDMASGYRNCKNGNKSVIAASSALTFSLINTLFNDFKNRRTKNITFSGTGFYIRGDIIELLGGYPFNTLTEDYEISMYAVLNNLTTYYNKNSAFYDEQPVKYKDTINQRQRWIRGYFDVRKKYSRKIRKSLSFNDKNFSSKLDESFGVIPYILVILGIFIYLSGLIISITKHVFLSCDISNLVLELIIFLLSMYLILLFITLILIILESEKINLNLKMKIKVLLFNPIFILTYIRCAIPALLKKNIEWKKIKHGIK